MKLVNISLDTFILKVLVISITLYAVKIFSLSPIYVIISFLMLLALISLILKSSGHLGVDSLIILILLFYLVYRSIGQFSSGEFINLSLACASYLYIRFRKQIISKNDLLKLIKNMSWVALILLGADSIYRLTNPAFGPDFNYIASKENLAFYLYKYNSLMFLDSNTTGLIAMVMFFLEVNLLKLGYPRNKFLLVGFAILIVLSLSRTAIIASLFSIVALNLKKPILLIISGFIFYVFFQVLFGDFTASISGNNSLITKASLLDALSVYLTNASFTDIIFGVGFENSLDRIGDYTHLLYLSYFVSLGLLGLILICSFLIYFSYKFGFHVTLPVAVASFSYFLYLGAPFLFVPLALLANLNSVNNEKVYVRG